MECSCPSYQKGKHGGRRNGKYPVVYDYRAQDILTDSASTPTRSFDRRNGPGNTSGTPTWQSCENERKNNRSGGTKLTFFLDLSRKQQCGKRTSLFERRGRVLSKEEKGTCFEQRTRMSHSPDNGRKGRRLFCGLFTTQYDVDLDECVRLFRDGSKALLASTVRDGKLSPKWMDNAITNVIRLVLEENGKPLPPAKVKGNLRWYLNVALKAKDTKDHNTAILLKSRPGALLPRPAGPDVQEHETVHGDLRRGVRHVSDVPGAARPRNPPERPHVLLPRGEIPSAMVVDMHLNRNKEHAKAFRQIGKMPQGIEDASDRLKERLALILRKFVRAGEMIPLYTAASGLTMPALFKLSSAVEQKKRGATPHAFEFHCESAFSSSPARSTFLPCRLRACRSFSRPRPNSGLSRVHSYVVVFRHRRHWSRYASGAFLQKSSVGTGTSSNVTSDISFEKKITKNSLIVFHKVVVKTETFFCVFIRLIARFVGWILLDALVCILLFLKRTPCTFRAIRLTFRQRPRNLGRIHRLLWGILKVDRRRTW